MTPGPQLKDQLVSNWKTSWRTSWLLTEVPNGPCKKDVLVPDIKTSWSSTEGPNRSRKKDVLVPDISTIWSTRQDPAGPWLKNHLTVEHQVCTRKWLLQFTVVFQISETHSNSAVAQMPVSEIVGTPYD